MYVWVSELGEIEGGGNLYKGKEGERENSSREEVIRRNRKIER